MGSLKRFQRILSKRSADYTSYSKNSSHQSSENEYGLMIVPIRSLHRTAKYLPSKNNLLLSRPLENQQFNPFHQDYLLSSILIAAKRQKEVLQ